MCPAHVQQALLPEFRILPPLRRAAMFPSTNHDNNAAAIMNHHAAYYQQPQGPPLSCNQAPKGLDCCCCKRCGVGGCDLKVLDCGCCFHTVRICVCSLSCRNQYSFYVGPFGHIGSARQAKAHSCRHTSPSQQEGRVTCGWLRTC